MAGPFDLVFVDIEFSAYRPVVEKILDKNLLATNGIILVDNGEWIAPLSWNSTYVRF